LFDQVLGGCQQRGKADAQAQKIFMPMRVQESSRFEDTDFGPRMNAKDANSGN
jgi:hypothetical protein